jgi:hypothetical protein
MDPISRKNLNYDNSFSFVLISHDNYLSKRTFRNFTQTDVSVKSVDSISDLWRPQSDGPSRSPILNPFLTLLRNRTRQICFQPTEL